jgi:hypothetical protein
VEEETLKERGVCGGHGESHWGQQSSSGSNCYYCKKPKHKINYFLIKGTWMMHRMLQECNYSSTSDQDDEQFFVM